MYNKRLIRLNIDISSLCEAQHYVQWQHFKIFFPSTNVNISGFS